MSIEKITYSFNSLRISIEETNRAFTNYLNELSKYHIPKDYIKLDGKIIRVDCYCGEQTNYKVPLKKLDDFVCPKKRKN